MDLIGALLSAVRAASPLLALERLGARAALAIPDNEGAPFHYVLEGTLQIIGSGEPITMTAGDLVLFPHGTPHRMRTEGAGDETDILEYLRSRDLPVWTASQGLEQPLFLDIGAMPPVATLLSGVVAFPESSANLLLPHLPELIVFRNVGSEIGDLTYATTRFVANEGRSNGRGFSAVALRMLELLIILALRRWLLETQHESGWLRGLQDPVISRALRAMHSDPGRRWQVGLLAREAGCSRSLFASRFHTVVGDTPFSYLTRLRISIASSQLRDTRRSVAQIATDLGYSSAYAFSRAFSDNTGQTPSRFRRENAETTRR